MQNSMIVKIHRRKLFFFLGLLLSLVLGIFVVNNLLVSFVLSFVGYFLLNPWVDILERRGFSRIWATTLPFLLFSLSLWVAVQLLLPLILEQYESLRAELPKYVLGFDRILGDVQGRIEQFLSHETSLQVIERVQNYLQTSAQNTFRELPNHISNSLTVLFLAPFLTFFMLVDGRETVRKILSLVPNSFFELALNLNHQISTQMGGFVRARLLESLIVAVVIWFGLMMMNFPYALVLSIFAGLLNLIPYIGPVIGAAPAFLIAMINQGPPGDLIALTLVFLTAQVIDALIIVPLVVAKIVNLHPVTVVLAVMVGSQVMGVLGMIISIPLASALKVTFRSLYIHLTDFRH